MGPEADRRDDRAAAETGEAEDLAVAPFRWGAFRFAPPLIASSR